MSERADAPPGWQGGHDGRWLEVLEADVRRLLREAGEARFQAQEAASQAVAEKRKLLLTLVDVVDAFERVFRAVAAKDDQVTPQMKIWLGNFRTVRRLVESALTAEGVVRMESLADGFDPQWHKVADLREDPARADGAILEVVQPGYLWKKELLRKAEVVVVKNGD